MREKEKLYFDYLSNSEKAISKLRQSGHDTIDSSTVWNILAYELEHYDIPTEIIFANLTEDDIYIHVKHFFDSSGRSLGSVKFDFSLIPDDLTDDLIKGRVKMSGEIWEVHKTDKDPFPSNPHAHNLESKYKVDLSNGDLYRKTVKIGNMRRKDFLLLRELIGKEIKDVTLPTLYGKS